MRDRLDSPESRETAPPPPRATELALSVAELGPPADPEPDQCDIDSEFAADSTTLSQLERFLDEPSPVIPDNDDREHARAKREPPDVRYTCVILEAPGADGTLGHVGRYVLLKKIGKGGFGVVYQARDESLGRLVALKIPCRGVLAATDLRARFLHEARAAARLDHPHIVPVHDSGEIGATCYIASAYCPGPTLLNWIRARSLPVPAKLAARLIVAVADALEHAHERGILHLDLKPGNILIQIPELYDPRTDLLPHVVEWADRGDIEPSPRVTDFGLAWIMEEDESPKRAASTLGTPPYMAPEQGAGATQTVSAGTDIYALGAILFELLAGRPPFLRGGDSQDLLRQIREDEPPSLGSLRRGLPRDVEVIVQKCLEKDAKHRYATAAELAADLRSFLKGMPIKARPLSPPQRAWRWSKRHPARAAAACLAMLYVVAGTVGMVAWNATLHRHTLELDRTVKALDDKARELALQSELTRSQEKLTKRYHRNDTILMAQQHEAAGQVERAQELLLEAAPESPDARRRDFAWRREWHESRQHLAFVWQHPSALVGMAISLDGRALVSSDRSGHVYAGSPRQEAPDWTIKTATEGMALLAFDSAARLLLACGNRGAGQRQEIQLLDAATGRLRSRIEGLEDRHVQSMTFLPDGAGLAFSTTSPTGADADIRFYDLRLDRAEPSHRARIETATTTVLPRRGSLVAVIGRHDSLGVVDLATGELVWSVERKCPVEAAATTVDGRYLAACRGGEVFVWNWENECPVVSRTLPGAITGISFLPDRKTLCVQTAEGTIVLIDVISGSERLIRPDTMDRARRVIAAVSDNGAMIATNSYGHPGGSSPLTLWDARTGSRIAECIGRGGMPDCLEFAPDGRTLYIGRDRWVGRWNLDATPQPAPITAHTDEAWSAEFSYNGLNLVTSSDDTDDRQTLKLWTVDPASRVAPLTLRLGWHAHNATVSDTAFSPDGKAVATVSLEPTHSVMLWDAASGRLLDELLGHTDWVRSVAFSPNGKWLATAGCDRTVRIWDVAARACVHILTGHTNKIRSVAFSRDGAQLTSAGNDGFIHTWDVETGSLLRSLDARENIVDVKYSNDGSTIAAAGASGYVWLIDATDGKTPRRVPADVDELICLTFSSSGEVLATAGISGTIHLLDPRTGQELLTLKGHKAQVNALAFNPDDTMLVSCDHAGQLRVWRADP